MVELFMQPGGASLTSNHWLDACCFQTYQFISLLHTTTGLSWALTLPLTAFVIRTVFVTPLLLYSRRHRNRGAAIKPLVAAWGPILQHRVYKENAQLGPVACQKLFVQSFNDKRKELNSAFNVTNEAAWVPLLQLPVWLLAVETVRKMCGTRDGLLGLVAKNFRTNEGASETGEGISSALSVPIETGFQDGGALWFSNLLAPDPLLILPFMLSATIFANIALSQRQAAMQGLEPSKFGTRVTRVFQLVALAAGPATLQVPSAILVYWISSTTLAIAQNAIIDKALPRPLTVSLCKPVNKSYLAGRL